MNKNIALNYPVSISMQAERWFGFKLHLVSVLSVITISFISKSPVLILVTGGFISFATYMAIGFYESKKSPVFFSPLSFYFFWYSVSLGLAAIYFGYIIYLGERISFSTATVQYNYIVNGYIIYLIGSLFLHAGFLVLRPRSTDKAAAADFRTLIGPRGILVLIIFSSAIEFFPEYFNPFGTIVNFLRFGLIAAVSIFALTDHRKFKISPRLHLLLIFIGCVTVFIINISTTSKAYMMFAFFPLIWYLIMDRKKWKYIAVIILLLIPFYLFIIYPVSYELRAQVHTGRQMNKSEAFRDVLLGNTYAAKDFGYGDDPISAYLARSFDPVAVAYLNQQVDLYGFQEGETLGYLAFAFVPRMLWPDKPKVTQGGWFSYYLGFARSPDDAVMSLGITATGELFWNFGFTGVIIGMFLIGIIFSALWRMAGDDPRNSILPMLLYVNLLFSMPNMSESGSVLVGTVSLFLVFKFLFVMRGVFIKK